MKNIALIWRRVYQQWKQRCATFHEKNTYEIDRENDYLNNQIAALITMSETLSPSKRHTLKKIVPTLSTKKYNKKESVCTTK
jgi:hypothetical protein